ncbi:olfactory receptor, partial [Pelobates cultripes]
MGRLYLTSASKPARSGNDERESTHKKNGCGECGNDADRETAPFTITLKDYRLYSIYIDSPMYFFLGHLSFNDMIIITNIVPEMLYIILREESTISFAGCFTQIYFFIQSTATECLLLTVMSYDRYLAICNPLRYSSVMDLKLCGSLVASSWGFGTLVALPHIIILSQLTFCGLRVNHFFCELIPVLRVSCSGSLANEIVIIVLSVPVTFVPILFITVTYINIFLVIMRISTTTRKQKAFSTCSSHLTVVCLYYGTLVFNYLFPSKEEYLGLQKLTSVLYTIMIPLLNPIIYSLRNEQVRGGGGPHTPLRDMPLLANIQNVKILLFIFFLIIYLVTLSANIMVISMVSMCRYIVSPMYFFLGHLSFNDMIIITNIVPEMLYIILREEGTMSLAGCFTQIFFFIQSVVTECLLLTVMSYDRYLAICNPLRYSSVMDLKLCSSLVALSWGLGILAALPHNVILSQMTFCGLKVVNHFFCELIPVLRVSCSGSEANTLVSIILSVPLTFVPILFITVTYINIFLVIIQISTTTGKQKAYSTCSSHLTVVCLYYGTLVFNYLVPSKEEYFGLQKLISVLYTIVTPLLNPIIYSLRNEQFKGRWKKMLRRGVSCDMTASKCQSLVVNIQNVKILLFIFFLIIYLVTLSANIMVISMVSMCRYIVSPMYFFLGHLSFNDMIIITNIVPEMLYIILREEGTMSLAGCFTQIFFFIQSVVTECLLLTVMSYDRYLAICNPLRYSSVMDLKLCSSLVALSWGLGILAALPHNVILSQMTFCGLKVVNHFFCELIPVLRVSCSGSEANTLVSIILSVPLTFVPILFITVTYINIFLVIIQISTTTGKQKAYSTCSSHLTVVCLYYGTLVFNYLVPSKEEYFGLQKLISVLYTIVTPLLNPIIYSLRNEQFKGAIIQIILKRKERRGRQVVSATPLLVKFQACGTWVSTKEPPERKPILDLASEAHIISG